MQINGLFLAFLGGRNVQWGVEQQKLRGWEFIFLDDLTPAQCTGWRVRPRLGASECSRNLRTDALLGSSTSGVYQEWRFYEDIL